MGGGRKDLGVYRLHPTSWIGIMPLPDYQKGSIVNLMSSIVTALGGNPLLYPPLPEVREDWLGHRDSVVLMVVDGLGYEYLTKQGRGSVLEQHLSSRITSVFPTTTASAITTFFTACAPQQHALTGWFTYLKAIDHVAAVLPYRARANWVSLRVLGLEPKAVFDQSPVFDQLSVPSYLVLPARIVDSEYTFVHGGSAERRAYVSLKHCFQCIEDILAQESGRKYIYAYWPELDTLAHAYGMNSAEVSRHFAELDAAFSEFLSSTRARHTKFVVTADHGFVDSRPEEIILLADHPELAETLIKPLCGEPRVAYCYVHPDRCERFEAYVNTRLSKQVLLVPSRNLVNAGYFGYGEPHPELFD
ncbi:MAG: alkaline phosphatase family protein, partial [Gammaproteobacteria bacterium]|nr:alkaline phosphatase family protein [Gammaproteobacteria bacterium]